MFIQYPKMKTLFKLIPLDDKGRKWSATEGEILPETAPLHYLPLESLVFTEKIDGTNMAIRINDETIQKRNGDCNIEDKSDRFYLEIKDSILNKILQVEELSNCIIYGELCGPKIQKGGNYFQERKFLVFDIYNTVINKFFTWDAVTYFCNTYGLDIVPEIEYTENNLHVDTVKTFIQNQMSVFNKDYPAEGLVVRYRKDITFDKRWMAKIRKVDFNL